MLYGYKLQSTSTYLLLYPYMGNSSTSAYKGETNTMQGRNIFPANLKEQILATIDIVAVLKKWLPLRKK